MSLRLFLFRLDEELFALRGEHVRGVLAREAANQDASWMRVPGATASGLAASLLVVACPGGGEALLAVDRVKGFVELRDADLRSVPAFVFPDGAATVSDVFAADEEVAALLDPAGLDLRPARSRLL